MNLKIVTYNIHKGFDWGKRNYYLQDIKKLITSSKANIVFLQEVVGENHSYKQRGLIDTQFEYFADSIWNHYSYAKNSVTDHGNHGNLVLSEFPIESWENINISTNPYEKRGLLVCKILLPENKLNRHLYIVCIHLDLLNRGRRIQYKMIKDHLKSLNIPEDAPVIMAGDFNDWNKQASHVFETELQMTETYKSQHQDYARTFPAAIPILALDRIYVKNLKIIKSAVLPSPQKNHFSDHLPLFCEVEI